MQGVLPRARRNARAYNFSERPSARKRSAAFGALTAVIVLSLALPAASTARERYLGVSAAGCAGASSASLGPKSFARAMLCLHDRARRSRGIGALRWNNNLARAATVHARDMVRRHYFDHTSPQHRGFMDMIAATGYGGSGCWGAGENLGLAHGPATPRQLLTAWMRSPAHRPNILRRRWHDFGLAMVRSSPLGERTGLTVVALFGTHTVRVCR
jgi:uncharacterized protein YkwD